MDPTITKASTGNERLVAACAESQSTSRGPNRTRFLAVQAVIRAKMQCDKKTLFADADASKNRLHQTLVEKLVQAHTNLVLRESLDDALHHLLPWDIELIIDEPVDQTEEEPEV